MSKNINTGKTQAIILADLCASYGLRKVVISPGSRNAPLIMAFHHHEDTECYVIPDERSASYFALGMALNSEKPVGLICTSGTAALNYTPALAEAYYQKVPLLAITADRPPEWTDQLDGQTINQTGIFTNFTSYQAQLPTDVFSENELWHIQRIVRDAFLHLNGKRLPVHLNVPFREPLYNLAEQKELQLEHSVSETFTSIPKTENDTLALEIKKYSKILLVFGMRRPDPAFSRIVDQLASSRYVVILNETLSNIHNENLIQMSDDLLSFTKNDVMGKVHEPELIISFGDLILSKPVKQWLRSLKSASHWIICEDENVPDNFQKIKKIIRNSPSGFLQFLIKHLPTEESLFFKVWGKLHSEFIDIQHVNLLATPWSDLLVFKMLSESVPGNFCVHLGNSTPVRYAQFFEWKKGIRFYGNRGTAGIDGPTSTALGMSNDTDRPVLLITGDMSFVYDSNALWNNYKRNNFKIIVINNKGGNLFNLIHGPESTGLLKKYFVAHVPVSIELLCDAYGIKYYMARNEEVLASTIHTFYESKHCSLLEIQTDPVTNTRVWKNYFIKIKKKSDKTYVGVNEMKM